MGRPKKIITLVCDKCGSKFEYYKSFYEYEMKAYRKVYKKYYKTNYKNNEINVWCASCLIKYGYHLSSKENWILKLDTYDLFSRRFPNYDKLFIALTL